MFYGLKTGLNEAFEVSDERRKQLLHRHAASATLIKPLLGGQDIRRYYIEDSKRYLITIPSGWTRAQYSRAKRGATPGEREAWAWLSSAHPTIAEHLRHFETACRKRQDQGDFWWELRPCDYYAYLEAPKIIFPDICKGPRFYLDTAGFYLANTAYCLGANDLFLLGVLNSKLFWFAISHISIPFGVRAGRFRYRLIYQYMEHVPIRTIDPQGLRPKIGKLAEDLLSLGKLHVEAQTPQVRTSLERQIAAASDEVDRLVCALYGLTEDDGKVVDASIGQIGDEQD